MVVVIAFFIVGPNLDYFSKKSVGLSPSNSSSLVQAPSINSGQASLYQPIVTPNVKPNYFPIRDFNIPDPELTARAALLYDMGSGRFLYQKNNEEQALKRLNELIYEALKPRKERKKTKVPALANERRIQEKKIRGRKKELRKGPIPED